METKVIARVVFEVVVEECAASKYRNMKDDDCWYFAAYNKLTDLGITISDDDFSRARASLLKSGFIERTNVKCNSKYSRGFFALKPTAVGLKRLSEVSA